MKISVVIPAFNAAGWLPAAVASVCSQSRPADEILIVDDGSTDDTGDVCRTFPEGVRYVRRENGGLSAARNTGVAATTGDWLLFLDADDILVPGALASLARSAESTEAGVVYGFVLQRLGEATKTRLHGIPYAAGSPPAPAKAHFWWTAIPTAGAALIRRSLNEEIGGFDERFRQVEDAEYWLRCGVVTSFAHCDSLVLDKSFTSSSLGQNETASIWFRLQLQMKFLEWCRRRDIDTSFLEATPAKMIDHALIRIQRTGSWAVLEPVIRHADRLRVRTPWYWRSRAHLLFLKLSGKLPAPNPKCREVFLEWLNSGDA